MGEIWTKVRMGELDDKLDDDEPLMGPASPLVCIILVVPLTSCTQREIGGIGASSGRLDLSENRYGGFDQKGRCARRSGSGDAQMTE